MKQLPLTKVLLQAGHSAIEHYKLSSAAKQKSAAVPGLIPLSGTITPPAQSSVRWQKF